jgi:hypothetical protein
MADASGDVGDIDVVPIFDVHRNIQQHSVVFSDRPIYIPACPDGGLMING